MIMIIRVLLLLFVSPCVIAQDIFSNSVSLTVYEDSLVCRNGCNTIDIQLKVSNDSNDDILVYGLPGEGIMRAPFDLSTSCNLKDTGCAIAFGIYSLDGKQLRYRSYIIDYYGQRKVTKQVLDSALLVIKKDFISSAIVLKGHEHSTFVKRLSLKDFELEKGRYYVQVVYYSGERISDVLDIKEVTQKSKAKLYRGCTFSSKIPLIIE